MRYLKTVAILVGVCLMTLTANAAQPLPASAWYSVLWVMSEDTLYWVNESGAQAALPRPHLPNEKATESDPSLKISPDGRYLVTAATLNSDLRGLGIYDLQNGAFVQVHAAQPGETINLGKDYSFTLDGRFMAVGFMSGTFDAPAWRIITFEMATGNAMEVLNHTDDIAPVTNNLVMPLVMYYNVNLDAELEEVHFQLIPQGTGGAHVYDAYAWSPLFGQVNPSPYMYSTMDIMPATGAMTRPGVAEGYPVLEPQGPYESFNAILTESPGQPIEVEAVNGALYHGITRWAKGGAWVLYETNAGDASTWNITETEGSSETNSQFPFAPNIISAYGTSDGYIFVDDTLRLSYTNGFTTNTAPVVWQAPDVFNVVYVTPLGAQFTLTSVADAPVVVPTPNVPQGAVCGTSLPSRLSPNTTARVTFTDGTTLRLRETPGGTIIDQLTEGTEFIVLEGPQCINNFNWWRIQLTSDLSGWAAEADDESYFMEPWAILGEPPQQPSATATPLVLQPLPSATPLVFQPLPTVTKLVFQPVASATPLVLQPVITPMVINPVVLTLLPDGDCSFAPVQKVNVGDTVTVTIGAGATLAMRTNVTDEFPSVQVPDKQSVKIADGPSCHKGYRMWRIQYVAGAAVSGWVSEGTKQQYFLTK